MIKSNTLILPKVKSIDKSLNFHWVAILAKIMMTSAIKEHLKVKHRASLRLYHNNLRRTSSIMRVVLSLQILTLRLRLKLLDMLMITLTVTIPLRILIFIRLAQVDLIWRRTLQKLSRKCLPRIITDHMDLLLKRMIRPGMRDLLLEVNSPSIIEHKFLKSN